MTSDARFRLAVITVSDRCSHGERQDRSGDLIVQRFARLPADIVSRSVVPDDVTAIRRAAEAAAGVADLVVLTGGTGLAPRDVTPQALGALLDYEVPGIAEAMRQRGLAFTPHAMLSRQLAGVRGRSLILCLPGSTGAVADCLEVVMPVIPHALDLLSGATVDHGPPPSA